MGGRGDEIMLGAFNVSGVREEVKIEELIKEFKDRR